MPALSGFYRMAVSDGGYLTRNLVSLLKFDELELSAIGHSLGIVHT
jgi:hypothetical protein